MPPFDLLVVRRRFSSLGGGLLQTWYMELPTQEPARPHRRVSAIPIGQGLGGPPNMAHMALHVAARLRILATRRTEWVDQQSGAVEVDRETWRSAWDIAGPHSRNWRWVRRYGTQPCGCVINPLTRRRVTSLVDCPEHGLREFSEE